MKYFHETFHLFSAFMGYYRLTYSKGFQLVSKHIWILFALRNIEKYNIKRWENILFLLTNIHSFFLLCPNNTLCLTQTHSNIFYTFYSIRKCWKFNSFRFAWIIILYNGKETEWRKINRWNCNIHIINITLEMCERHRFGLYQI